MTIDINCFTPFPALLAYTLYENDIDLMISDLKDNRKLIEEAKKLKKIVNVLNVDLKDLAQPIIISELKLYLEELNIDIRKLDHVSLNTLYDLVITKLENYEYDEIQDIIIFMIEIDPNFAPAYEILGSLFAEKGDMEKAKEYLEKAIKLDPENVDALMELGEIYYSLKEYSQAAEIWEKSLEKEPNNIINYFLAANSYRLAGNLEKASNILKKALNRWPKNITAKYHLACLLKETDKKEEALKIEREIIDSYPEYLGDVQIWSRLMLEYEEYERLMKFLDKITQDAYYEYLKALMIIPLIKKGKKEEALKLAKSMLEKYRWHMYSLKSIFEEFLDNELVKKIYS